MKNLKSNSLQGEYKCFTDKSVQIYNTQMYMIEKVSLFKYLNNPPKCIMFVIMKGKHLMFSNYSFLQNLFKIMKAMPQM